MNEDQHEQAESREQRIANGLGMDADIVDVSVSPWRRPSALPIWVDDPEVNAGQQQRATLKVELHGDKPPKTMTWSSQTSMSC